jgi:hypothetical protein
LIQLSNFFDALCSKELVEAELDRLSCSIREVVCRLEMIFPPAFFDIMIQLPVHLAEEAKLGGPVCYRWMYPVERYLRNVKGYVRNKAKLEGSCSMRSARNKFVGKSYNIRNTSSSWTHLGSYKKKCQHGKKKGKQKGENMHDNLKKVKR